MAPIGDYQVRMRMRTGIFEKTLPFRIEMSPNLKGVTEEDIQEQFDLASQIRNKTTEANNAVIKIRSIRSQIEKQNTDHLIS